MNIKDALVATYEKLYASNLVMNAIYHYHNRNYRLNILSAENTLDYILTTECSVARFGEGEFELMLHSDMDLGFQGHNPVLAEKLSKTLANKNQKLLICIPYALNHINGRTEHSRKFWFYWGNNLDQHHRVVTLIRQLHPDGYCFGDTQITRPYIAYKTPTNAKRIFPELKLLWQGKDVLFVEGEKTRLGIGNDLFDDARSIKRILCPATNAFACYSEILNAVKKVWTNELVLCALGPTATVLVADLADLGIPALDLGHVDIEYEWFRTGARGHDLVSGKFTNEAAAGNQVADCNDENYINQILCRIKNQNEKG